MRFNKRLNVVLMSVLLLSSLVVQAEVRVDGAWLRLLPPMSKMTAAYMTLTSEQEDYLIAASSDIARAVEVHQSKMEEGVMRMQEVKRLHLPKGESVELKPQSYHLMVMGLHSHLQEGDSHQFTLEFERAGKVMVQVPVRNP